MYRIFNKEDSARGSIMRDEETGPFHVAKAETREENSFLFYKFPTQGPDSVKEHSAIEDLFHFGE